jgi:hypothetical protein
MSVRRKLLVLLTDIGKGLVHNPITKFVDVQLSTDSGNSLGFGSDNGLFCRSGEAVSLQFSMSLGSVPVYSKHMTFEHVLAKTTSIISLTAHPDADELEMDGLVCSAGCNTDGIIDLYITAVPGPIIGARTFNLTIR